MRIGNVIQSSPSHPFGHGVQAIPQFHQNNLVPFTLPNKPPSPGPFNPYQTSPSYAPYPQHASIAGPTPAYPQSVLPKQGYTLYSYAQQFPQQQIFPTSPAFAPTAPYPSPAYNTATNPHFPLQNSPVRSFLKFRTPTQYAYESFGVVDKTNGYPFQQLNAGETLPQPNTLNLNFGLGEVYRPNRFARNPSPNATSHH